MVARVHALLPALYDWSGADGKPGASEDRRERAEVQRSYYAFLNALAQSRLLQCLQASQPHSIFRRRIHCLGAFSCICDEVYIIMFTCLSVLPSEATDERSILCCNCLCALKVMSEKLWKPECCNAEAPSQSQAGLPAQGSAGTLDAVLEALLRGASTHTEPQTRKTCVQVWWPAQMTMHHRP